jgi:putative redox protein
MLDAGMSTPKPPVAAELIWSDALQFGATSGSTALIVDGDSVAGPSPVQLLAIALAGCMAIDVVDILRKGRHAVRAFRTTVTGDRAAEPPRRLLRVQLRFHVHGDVPDAAVERAIALSREKYCSVWHSLRQDIELTTAFDVVA